MVVAPQPLAAEVGLNVLRAGGNAVDAAVTIAFCQGVVDPQMCGIGGGGVMLVYSATRGRTEVIEFHPRAGSQVQADQWDGLFLREAADRYGYVLEGWVNDVGHASVGVPGTVLGLSEALARHGTLRWDDVIRPAITLARDGVPISGFLREYWLKDVGPDVISRDRRIAWTPDARRIFTRNGELFRIGEILVQTDYAVTLERIANDGASVFYHGDLADTIAADFAANGGFITRKDLADYRVKISEPLAGTYRDRTLITVGPPAGGMTLVQMLNFLEGFDLQTPEWPSLEEAQLRVEAMRWAFRDRERYLADPDYSTVPVESLIDKRYAADARAQFHTGARFIGVQAHESPSTTHVCVVDDQGNAVSLTHTLGAASGVVTPGLGFMFNNYLKGFDPRPGRPNSLAPGKTRRTMMAPTMLFDGDRLEIVIGAPGGTKIVTGVLQTLLNFIDHRQSPVESVSSPRIDFQGDTVEAEGRIPGSLIEALRNLGYRVQRRALNFDSYFAQVQLIVIDKDGRLRGAADPRKDGGAALST